MRCPDIAMTIVIQGPTPRTIETNSRNDEISGLIETLTAIGLTYSIANDTSVARNKMPIKSNYSC